MQRPLIVGNWKMNGASAGIAEGQSLASAVRGRSLDARVVICPPTTLLDRLRHVFEGTEVALGGQDCHAQANGAFTGDVSAEMLAEVGAELVILGHSERRTAHSESSAAVAAKARGALRAGLEPIVCVGESLGDRTNGHALDIVSAQTALSVGDWCGEGRFSIAYEPIWAIGTGRIPTVEDIEAVHRAIRKTLAEYLGTAANDVPILYGGSVNAENISEILTAREVGGALVGGASLRAADFLRILASLP